MSRYRKIDPRIWNDAKFMALSERAKLLFLMLLSHPAMTSIGAFRATIAGLAEELGVPVEGFREAFAEVLSKGMAKHDAEAHCVALPHFVRYNGPESPNVVRAWVASLDLIPECPLKIEQIQRARQSLEGREAFCDAFDEAFAKGFQQPCRNQEQEPEQKQEEGRARVIAMPSKRPPNRRKTVTEAARERLREIG